MIRYAGRNRIEDGLGISLNFFHLDCLASEVRLNVDLDAALTVIANGCYRWLASRLRGFEEAALKQLYIRFVETGGTVQIQEDGITVAFERRSHNPILREAALARSNAPVKIVQTLARHSTPTLTLEVCAPVELFDQSSALDTLPDPTTAVPGPEAASLAATGTDPVELGYHNLTARRGRSGSESVGQCRK
jgi:hypothetical protein